MKMTIAMIAVAGLAGSASAALNASVDASVSAEIRNDGARLFNGDISTAFWNVQPAGNFATTGLMQFDVSGVVAQADATYGAGNWSVQDATFTTYQAPAGFTSVNATIDFWMAGVGADPTMTLAGLSGIDFSNVQTAITAVGLVDNYNFVLGADGDQNDINLGSFGADFLTGGLFTLSATSDDGVASWVGSGPINGSPAPSISFTIVPAPAGVAVLGLGGLVAARRRR